MTRWFTPFAVLIMFVLTGCAQPSGRTAPEPPPLADSLYSPANVVPGHLEYAVDRSTFAPVLTERYSYPTQLQANFAYQRFMATAPNPHLRATSLALFGCKPGALDEQTSRVTRYRGPVVHCATDFLDANGQRAARRTVNFYYYRSAWNMQMVTPRRAAVRWRNRESSPTDFWWWVPGRDRYE